MQRLIVTISWFQGVSVHHDGVLPLCGHSRQPPEDWGGEDPGLCHGGTEPAEPVGKHDQGHMWEKTATATRCTGEGKFKF